MQFFKNKTIQQIQESAVAAVNAVIENQRKLENKAIIARKKAEAKEEAARLEITKGQAYIANYNKMFEIPAEDSDAEEHFNRCLL